MAYTVNAGSCGCCGSVDGFCDKWPMPPCMTLEFISCYQWWTEQGTIVGPGGCPDCDLYPYIGLSGTLYPTVSGFGMILTYEGDVPWPCGDGNVHALVQFNCVQMPWPGTSPPSGGKFSHDYVCITFPDGPADQLCYVGGAGSGFDYFDTFDELMQPIYLDTAGRQSLWCVCQGGFEHRNDNVYFKITQACSGGSGGSGNSGSSSSGG